MEIKIRNEVKVIAGILAAIGIAASIYFMNVHEPYAKWCERTCSEHQGNKVEGDQCYCKNTSESGQEIWVPNHKE